MKNITQDNHSIAIESPFGKDILILTKFNGVESISEPFSFVCELISLDGGLDPKKIVGQPVTLTAKFDGAADRHFNGNVSQFKYVGAIESGQMFKYQAIVVPKLWFATKAVDCKMYQELSFKDILAEKLSKHGIKHRFDLKGTHNKHPYTVQFNESDFSFVSRLMEEEGMFYYFEHSKSKHEMVITDAVSTFKDCIEKELFYGYGDAKDNQITNWLEESNFTSGKHSYKNFDFEKPSKPVSGDKSAVSPLFKDVLDYEVYEYPGEALKPAGLQLESKTNVEGFLAEQSLFRGAANCHSMTPGTKFKVNNSTHDGIKNKKFQLLQCEYEAADDTYLNTGSAQQTFATLFSCTLADVPYRSEKRHAKPLVGGLQSATVTGPSGEEIFVDKYGRVKVQFHWDRDGKSDENSSCFIRVSQSWAGEKWGTFFHPRIGDEVLVDFIDGDLDCPIIVGRVYNGKNMPFHALPANQTKSGIKSQSSKNAGGANYSEISIEDKKDAEQVFIHAEKDYLLEVEKDETHWVGKNRTKTIDENETNLIKKNRKTTVEENYDLTVVKDRTTKIEKNDALEVTKNRTAKIDKNDTLEVAKKITIDAGKEIEIKTGAASIIMKADGTIKIKGVKVSVEGTKVDVKGSAMVKIKGGVVNIN